MVWYLRIKNVLRKIADEPVLKAAAKQLFAKAARRLARAFAKSCFAATIKNGFCPLKTHPWAAVFEHWPAPGWFQVSPSLKRGFGSYYVRKRNF